MIKICKKVFNELSVATNRKGDSIFSLCCYMKKSAWFRAASINEAMVSSHAERIRQNAINNKYGYCSTSCPNWEIIDFITTPVIHLERFEISASTRCNARCSFCFQAAYNIDLNRRIIDEFRKDLLPHLKKVGFGGGEPLLVSFDLIEEIARDYPQVKISLVTNGILLNKIIRFKDHVEGINISLNAGNPDTYKRVMKVDAFDRVVSNIKSLKNAGFDKSISSTYVICRENMDDIKNYLTVCKALGIETVGFNVDKTDPFLKLPVDLIKTIHKYAEEIGIPIKLGIVDLSLSLAGRLKQIALYYSRYQKRHLSGKTKAKGIVQNPHSDLDDHGLH